MLAVPFRVLRHRYKALQKSLAQLLELHDDPQLIPHYEQTVRSNHLFFDSEMTIFRYGIIAICR